MPRTKQSETLAAAAQNGEIQPGTHESMQARSTAAGPLQKSLAE